jgi:hypothetical protein
MQGSKAIANRLDGHGVFEIKRIRLGLRVKFGTKTIRFGDVGG